MRQTKVIDSTLIQVRSSTNNEQPNTRPAEIPIPALYENGPRQEHPEQQPNTKNFKIDFVEYWQSRWQKSNIRKFYLGTGLTSKEVDDVVNALSVVNALILTIPFSTITSLNNSYWDWLRQNIISCDSSELFHEEYQKLLISLYGSAYSSMVCVLIAVMYYILRPDNRYFDEWWARAKWAVVIIALGTALSIGFILTMFGSLTALYATDTLSLCNTITENATKYNGSVIVLTIICGICFFLMF